MTRNQLFRSERGFTLIELLVVIVIIGILATGAIAVFTGTQEKARDAVRKGDLKTTQNAIELFKADGTGDAPLEGELDDASPTGLVGDFIQALPIDPTLSYGYLVDGDEADAYRLIGDEEETAGDTSDIDFGNADEVAAIDSDCTDGATDDNAGCGLVDPAAEDAQKFGCAGDADCTT